MMLETEMLLLMQKWVIKDLYKRSRPLKKYYIWETLNKLNLLYILDNDF